MKIFSGVSIGFLFFMALFVSCKKDPVPGIDTLAITSVTSTTAIASGSIAGDTGGSSIIASGVCYATTTDPTILDSIRSSGVTVGDFSLLITNLNENITYYVRAFITTSAGTIYGTTMNFTTPVLTINYAKYFDSVTQKSYSDTQLFSIEGAIHRIYGSGFKKQPITVKMFSRTNIAEVIMPAINIISDSVFTFSLPKAILSQSPYVINKRYFVTINNRAYRSYYGFKNPTLTDTAIFVVTNTDIKIDTVIRTLQTDCNSYTIQGKFASDTRANAANPDSILRVLSKPVSRVLIVKSADTVYQNYTILNGVATCGNAAMVFQPYSSPLYNYHDAGQIELKAALPVGVFTFTVQNKMKDSSVVTSAVYSFSNL